MTNKKLIQIPTSSMGKNTKLIKWLLLLGFVMIVGYLIYINFIAPPAISNLELFTLQSDKYYGNLLTFETGLTPAYDASSKPKLIKLPGRVKLTRFKINGPVLSKLTAPGDSTFFYGLDQNIGDADMTIAIPGIAGKFGFVSRDALNKVFPERIDRAAAFTLDSSGKLIKADSSTPAANIIFWAHTEYTEPKFRVYIADNETEIYDVTKRTAIIFDNNTGCTLNTSYSDPALFETNNKAKYVGSVLLVDPVDSMNPVYITGYEAYGMAPYSPGFDDYDKMPEITGTSKSADNTVITVSSSKDYKVGYLELVDNKAPHTGFNIRIQYDNSYDGQKNKYTVDGPVQLSYSNSSKYIFIDEPFIARTIYITPGYAGVVKVFGTLATKTDEKTFKLEQNKFDTKGIIVGGQKCPNMGQMMQKQLQAQQICEALEQKDRVRNKKLAYERDKVYLKKLGDQDAEIQDLTAKINTLINKKNERIKASAGLVDAKKLEAELEKVERLRKEAQDFMAKPDLAVRGLNLKVKLDPAFGELKRELANEL